MSVLTAPEAEAGRQAASLRPSGAPAAAGAADQPIDLAELLLPLWRRKWILIACTVLAATAGLVAALELDSSYTAETRVIYEPGRLRIIDLTNVVNGSSDLDIQMRNQVEILRSAMLLDRVIDTLLLERTPEFNPELRGDGEGSGLLASVAWPRDIALQLAKFGLVPDPRLTTLDAGDRSERLRTSILEQLTEGLRVRALPGSQVIEIGYSSTDPILAAEIVNTVAEQYIVVQTEQKRDEVAEATEILSTRVADLENRLKAAEEAVRVARVELASGGEFGPNAVAAEIETLQRTLAELGEERRLVEARTERARRDLDADEIYANPDFRASPLISALQASEADLRAQSAAIRSVVTAQSNPALVRIDARLDETQRNIRQEAGRVIADLEAQVATMRSRQASVGKELARLDREAREQSEAELRLTQLEREAEARRSIYQSFATRMNETSEQSTLQSPDARFLTRAVPPTEPDSSLRRMIVAAASLAGAGLGVGIILLLEWLNQSFRRSSEVEEQTGLTVFAGIPRTGRHGTPGQVLRTLLDKPASSLAESTRNLRTSILFSNLDQAPKVVMFASSLPGEGKTTTAMLAAVASQQMERSAVIVDCDFRRRTMTGSFPIDPEQPGLFAALQGTVPLDVAVYVEPETGVHVLAPERTGAGCANPADILGSGRFGRLIGQLRARYDLVILDTPPALAVADVRIAAQYADAVIYLIRWNRTRRKAVLEGLRELRSVNARVAGAAFTLVDERQAARYFAGDYLYKPSYGA